MTSYLTIRPDANYTRLAPTNPLIEFLSKMPELRPTGAMEFQSAEGFPWLVVTMARCDASGCYSSNGAFLEEINVVELVCCDAGDPIWYDNIVRQIVEFLGWSAFEDQACRQVWPSTR